MQQVDVLKYASAHQAFNLGEKRTNASFPVSSVYV